MKLSKKEKEELLRDARDPARRDAFRAVVPGPISFEQYLAILDDLTSAKPQPRREPPPPYRHNYL